MRSHFDAAGHFIHRCDKCGEPGVLGSGVSLRNGKLGTWHCGRCKLGAIARHPSDNKTEASLRAALQESVPQGSDCCPHCGEPGVLGYRNEAGQLVWFCEEHRPAKFWADAKRAQTGSVRPPDEPRELQIACVVLAASGAHLILGGRTERRQMVKALELKDKTVNVPAIGGTEVENILGAAQEDAGFEKLLKFKKGEYFIARSLSPSAPNSSRTR